MTTLYDIDDVILVPIKVLRITKTGKNITYRCELLAGDTLMSCRNIIELCENEMVKRRRFAK